MLKSQACSPEERNYRLSQKRYYLFLAVGTLLFLVLLLASTVSGNYKTSVSAAFRALVMPDYNTQIRSIILLSRLPRMLAAILTGAALSVSGLVYQDVFTNHMASPDILGVSSGSGFGASVAILLSLGYGSVCVFSFVGGMLTVCVTVSVSKLFGRENGLAIALSTLMTAVSVSVGGAIGWIGLAIPNMVRLALQDDGKYAMPLTILYGIDFTLISDLLARTLTLSEIPIGIITGVLGAVVFLLILTMRRRCYEA